jgi:hypothetical protein
MHAGRSVDAGKEKRKSGLGGKTVSTGNSSFPGMKFFRR